MKAWWVAGWVALAGGLGACAGTPQRVETVVISYACEREGGVLRMGGPSHDLLDCALTHDAEPPDVVVVSSFGGQVAESIAVADVLAGWDTILRVEGWCASSCANYFIPVARRVEVADRAEILLHGSIDDAHLARSRRNGFADGERHHAAQAGFEARHGVHRGWLLWRDEGDKPTSWGRHVEGEGTIWLPEERRRKRRSMISVTPDFAASCLPVVPFVWKPGAAALVRPGDIKLQERALDNGFVSTENMRCVDPEGA